MAFTVEQLKQRLAALQDARWRGVRDTTIEGRRVGYATDAEMAAAIADLEARVAKAEGRRRRRVVRPYAVKDL
ncbi:phage head-tail joining protein [Falsiroseomonas sp.]|uniref:phage head-tail joining protein n=1 Tax=Falsiroseomonas sp. TaxID=2870721 RepID=UPI0027226FC9|nr:hypothetical protein [Falsiroseomonas sp.]MDO9501222.1 hypothetical protein [Falsiroseomonas sp.]